MISFDIECPHCQGAKTYSPVEYVGQYLLCKACGKMVRVEEYYSQVPREARVLMWRDPGMRPYLRSAGLAEESD